MKKLLSIGTIIAVLAVISFTSCTKDGITPNPTPIPPVVEKLPTAPKLSLKLVLNDTVKTGGKALYDSSVKIVINTDGQVLKYGEIPISNSELVVSNLKKDTWIVIESSNTNKVGTTTTKDSIFVPVHPLETTQLHLLKPVHLVWAKIWIAGTENDSTKSIDAMYNTDGELMDCNSFKYNADGSSTSTLGSCHTLQPPLFPGMVINTPNAWQWVDITKGLFNTGAGYVVTIKIYSNGFDITQYRNGRFYWDKYRI
jgi:hypothetical protein